MDRKILKQYRFCKKRFGEINEEIIKLKCENNISQELYNERSECSRIIAEVSLFADNIKDVTILRAFILKYMEGIYSPKWEAIALKIGGGNTADSIRMAVSRYIEKS